MLGGADLSVVMDIYNTEDKILIANAVVSAQSSFLTLRKTPLAVIGASRPLWSSLTVLTEELRLRYDEVHAEHYPVWPEVVAAAEQFLGDNHDEWMNVLQRKGLTEWTTTG